MIIAFPLLFDQCWYSGIVTYRLEPGYMVEREDWTMIKIDILVSLPDPESNDGDHISQQKGYSYSYTSVPITLRNGSYQLNTRSQRGFCLFYTRPQMLLSNMSYIIYKNRDGPTSRVTAEAEDKTIYLDEGLKRNHWSIRHNWSSCRKLAQ